MSADALPTSAAMLAFDRVQREFAPVFNDARLNRRSVQVAAARFAACGASDAAASADDAARQGAYHLMNHADCTAETLLVAHRPALLDRCGAAPAVLLAGDTTELSYVQRQEIAGMGVLSKAHAQGLYAHVSYALAPDRLPLGVVDVLFLSREKKTIGKGNRPGRYAAPPEERESRKWAQTLDAAAALRRDVGPTPQITALLDREGSNSAILERADRERDQYYLIVRARGDHALEEAPRGPRAQAVLRMQPAQATYALDVPAAPHRAARTAQMELRFATVTLAPVRRHGPPGTLPTPATTVNLILATEANPPADLAPDELLDWRLYTTRPVTTAAEAQDCVRDYAARWGVEVLFRTWKSVQRTLERQYRSLAALQASLAMDLVLAFLHLHLTHLPRAESDAPATKVFSVDECQALAVYRDWPDYKSVPTLAAMCREIALLGGYRARKRDRPAGVMCFVRGLAKLAVLVVMWRRACKRLAPDRPEPSALTRDL